MAPHSNDPSIATHQIYQPTAQNFSRPRPSSSASSSGTVLSGPNNGTFGGAPKDADGAVIVNGWARRPSIPKNDSRSAIGKEAQKQLSSTPRPSGEGPPMSAGSQDVDNTASTPFSEPFQSQARHNKSGDLLSSETPTSMARHSSPAAITPATAHQLPNPLPTTTPSSSLRQRHTLQVPKTPGNRISSPATGSDALTTGRFSPTSTAPRRGSLSLARRPTTSIHEEIPPDEDAAKWTEAIKAKRAEKRRREEEEADDKVVVGTKVDHNHANWVTAYNMLTGIRFVVSRINAKMDRDLTDEDFSACHKFSFDM